MAKYKMVETLGDLLPSNVVLREDGVFVPTNDHGNIDCIAYLEWVSSGNKPDPADK